MSNSEAPSPSSEFATGRHGAVAAGHPLAADTALAVLRAGGNAVDAVIAGSAVQCVAEMPWCGIGGDGFALVRTADGQTVALNGSGAAPLAIDSRVAGLSKIPRFGPLSVSTPGLVDAWSMLAERFGRRSLHELLAPAISYAEGGVPLDRRLRRALEGLTLTDGGDQLAALLEGVRLDGASGPWFRQPGLAATLAAVAEGGRDAFYDGPIARRIAAHVRSRGGVLDSKDFSSHAGEWCEPLSVGYRDAVVSTQPPVSMGVLLLAGLHLLEHLTAQGFPSSPPARTDLLVAIKHVLFERALTPLGDPRFVDFDPRRLLDDRWVQTHAPTHRDLAAAGADTTTIAVTDDEGMTVTLIHSLFNEFGARELVPGTGIVLNDRLANVAVDGELANGLRGGKRPMHTLHSYLATRADGTLLAGATPGGRGQVQTNMQVLCNIIDGGDRPDAAIDRPRWVNGLPRRSPTDDTLYLEATFPANVAAELSGRGHRVEVLPDGLDDNFGCCTIVTRAPDGTVSAAADHRRHAAARAY